jgi:hypothetical protein
VTFATSQDAATPCLCVRCFTHGSHANHGLIDLPMRMAVATRDPQTLADAYRLALEARTLIGTVQSPYAQQYRLNTARLNHVQMVSDQQHPLDLPFPEPEPSEPWLQALDAATRQLCVDPRLCYRCRQPGTVQQGNPCIAIELGGFPRVVQGRTHAATRKLHPMAADRAPRTPAEPTSLGTTMPEWYTLSLTNHTTQKNQCPWTSPTPAEPTSLGTTMPEWYTLSLTNHTTQKNQCPWSSPTQTKP